MTAKEKSRTARKTVSKSQANKITNTSSKANVKPADLLLASNSSRPSIPLYMTRKQQIADDLSILHDAQLAWLQNIAFKGGKGAQAVLPDEEGGLAGAVLGLGDPQTSSSAISASRLMGKLPKQLPKAVYQLTEVADDIGLDWELAAIAWGLGAYQFKRYKEGKVAELPALKLPDFVDRNEIVNVVEAVWLGRDLINTPSNDMGPDELERAARALAVKHRAKTTVIKGDKLLELNFPLIHAVGRASTRAPRLIDLRWGKGNAPTVTLIGKGIVFDTGGLNIKPATGMLLMKKDMGGAAAVLTLAHMIMAAKLPVSLRVLIPAAENAISGNAFRPGDIINSRSGLSVEIGNTDAEGRLVLADALAFADEEKPDYLMTFATLTGAARVALGPDLPPFYVDDDDFAARLMAAGTQVADPLWRMPFWDDYDAMLDSEAADMNSISFGGFAGSITAALFLRRFVKNTPLYAHFDIFGWRPAANALGPKGGEPNAARAVYAALKALLAA